LTALPWNPAVELLIFVHRVEELVPGLYALVRNDEHEDAMREMMSTEFLWERPDVAHQHAEGLKLYLLDKADTRTMAELISCQQQIASQGAFAVSMVTEFAPTLESFGPWFYRRLFWEAGVIGQILYLEAEAAGLRATGIGCYFDDAMHELLGLGEDKTFQALYHLTVGGPVDDPRLRTIPAYAHREKVMAKVLGN
jgi:nitroreductase